MSEQRRNEQQRGQEQQRQGASPPPPEEQAAREVPFNELPLTEEEFARVSEEVARNNKIGPVYAARVLHQLKHLRGGR